ncbi:MAG: hypothetical protein O0V67_00060 [Methanocorpusculum sp.]|nr:hypothetical protein [Methanocorpusculum sp.]
MAILTKRFEIIPRKRNVRIVYVLLRQVCFVMCNLRGDGIVRCRTTFAQVALRLQEGITARTPSVAVVELFCPRLHTRTFLSRA